jgi:hypothetical protein
MLFLYCNTLEGSPCHIAGFEVVLTTRFFYIIMLFQYKHTFAEEKGKRGIRGIV